MKYYITETQNINSTREGYEVTCSSLSSAKRIASKKQCFFGTCLTIFDCNKNIISVKSGESCKWSDK